MRAAMARPCAQNGTRAASGTLPSNHLGDRQCTRAAANSTAARIGVIFPTPQVRPANPRKIAPAFSNVPARKKIQVKHTKLKVNTPPRALYHQAGEGTERRRFQAKTTPNATPCNAPQIRKFHEMP